MRLRDSRRLLTTSLQSEGRCETDGDQMRSSLSITDFSAPQANRISSSVITRGVYRQAGARGVHLKKGSLSKVLCAAAPLARFSFFLFFLFSLCTYLSISVYSSLFYSLLSDNLCTHILIAMWLAWYSSIHLSFELCNKSPPVLFLSTPPFFLSL